ncbi:MAG: segregation/condensation protein A [Gammaproteobacteria bacterium]|nr:segregation/condensation protein A [Gammaproteobacteria bacterium]
MAQTPDSPPELSVVSPPPKEPVLPEETTGGKPSQAEMPFAVVDGEPVTQLPQDLYIPPYALKVFLEAFEGPLDLLLYLIRRQNLDILNIPIAEITRQYVDYIEMMQDLQLELAGEYLLMAAMLAEIKSRMLLPRSNEEIEDEDDPRAELVRRLQEYERYKQAAEDLNGLPRMERDVQQASAGVVEIKRDIKPPDVTMQDLLLAFKEVLSRAEMFAHHHIQREALSTRQRMSEILTRIGDSNFTEFADLFDPQEGRMGIAVTFIALLELLREQVIELVQAEPFSPIHVRAATGASETGDDGTDTAEASAVAPAPESQFTE